MAKIYSFSNAVLKTRIEEDIEELRERVYGKEVMELVAKKIKDLVQGRTRSGRGADGEPLKALDKNYVEYRKTLKKKKVKTGRFFKPEMSNLTLSGQLIDSITFETSPGIAHVFVPDDTRTDGQSNKEVADRVAKGGRPFMALDEQQRKIIDRMIEREANRIVREIIRRV